MKAAIYTILSIFVISTSTFANQCGSGTDADKVEVQKTDDAKPIDPKDLVNQDS